MTARQIISKVGSFCNTSGMMVLATAIPGATYVPAVFKMADEYSRPPYNCTINILQPAKLNALTWRGGGGALPGHSWL